MEDQYSLQLDLTVDQTKKVDDCDQVDSTSQSSNNRKSASRRSDKRENSAILADTVSQIDNVSEYSDESGSVRSQPEEWPSEIIGSYEIGRQIGRGSFGIVFLATHRQTSDHIAIKTVKRNRQANTIGYISNEQIDFEVKVAIALKDLNIIEMHSFHSEGNNVYMIMEFMAGGTLSGRINESGIFSEDIAIHYLRQLCSGVSYMHNRHLAHFDLKPDNLLLLSNDQRTILKVADFGMCKSTRNGPVRPNCKGGTIYSAPEVVNYEMYTRAADVWSVGVVLIVMLRGDVPFKNISSVKAAKLDTTLVDNISETVKIFLRNIFKVKPDDRPDIVLLSSDIWLNDKSQ